MQGGKTESDGRVVVRHPYDGPGRGRTAGVGVSSTVVPDGEVVTVEQLWHDGEAEPVYIEPRDIPALVKALTRKYAEVYDNEE